MNNAKTTILIIDDEAAIRLSIAEYLKSRDYETLSAKNGIIGLEVFKKKKVDLILLDLRMPGLDGLEVLTRVKKISPDLPMIVISGTGNISDAVEALHQGAWDYLLKPILDFSVLDHAINNSLEKARLRRENCEYQQSLERIVRERTKELERKNANIKRAQNLHNILTSKKIPGSDRFNIKASYLPCEEMGGDLLIITKTRNNNIIIILADCTGHGLEASMHTIMMKILCDKYMWKLEENYNTAEFVQSINRDVIPYVQDGTYPTMFVSILNYKEKVLYYSNANGELPYLIRKGNIQLLPGVKGFHLGFEKNMGFGKKQISLEKNDYIVFYSDALMDISRSKWNRLNTSKLKKRLLNYKSKFDSNFNDLLKSFKTKNNKFISDDDFTLVILEYKPPLTEQIIISEKFEIKHAVNRCIKNLREYDFEKEEICQIEIALYELLLNAITHGNKNNIKKKVFINYNTDFEKFDISIKDEGNGFDPEAVPDPTDEDKLLQLYANDEFEKFTHGRGIWIVKKYMNKISYNKKGNAVSTVKFRTVCDIVKKV